MKNSKEQKRFWKKLKQPSKMSLKKKDKERQILEKLKKTSKKEFYRNQTRFKKNFKNDKNDEN